MKCSNYKAVNLLTYINLGISCCSDHQQMSKLIKNHVTFLHKHCSIPLVQEEYMTWYYMLFFMRMVLIERHQATSKPYWSSGSWLNYYNNNKKNSIVLISPKWIELSGTPSTGVGQTHSTGTMQRSSTNYHTEWKLRKDKQIWKGEFWEKETMLIDDLTCPGSEFQTNQTATEKAALFTNNIFLLFSIWPQKVQSVCSARLQ